ncbi:MAG: hypothetical protein KDD34_03050 [Bdellovibrionales bacterium]|nr:hypothetical protein [Bdellovibrionales bacterium]
MAMDSFSCSTQCEELCSKSTVEQILAYFPRLSEGDRLVISKMPKEAFKVFLAKEKAEDLTKKIFNKSGKDDESDAFRHFVWSALVTKELGEDKAKTFLKAHEEDSTQEKNQKEMDTQNNKQGLMFVMEKVKNRQEVEIDQIEKEALLRLRNKKLKVLMPKLKKIPGGYYSK